MLRVLSLLRYHGVNYWRCLAHQVSDGLAALKKVSERLHKAWIAAPQRILRPYRNIGITLPDGNAHVSYRAQSSNMLSNGTQQEAWASQQHGSFIAKFIGRIKCLLQDIPKESDAHRFKPSCLISHKFEPQTPDTFCPN